MTYWKYNYLYFDFHDQNFIILLYIFFLHFHNYKSIEMNSKKAYTLKFLVVGDSGVGKTSILVRYC